jgi:ubiquinone/menaquinone biosynthesis C-methylase UbiE
MRRSLEKEMMDLPGNPRELLEDDLKNLRIINRCLGAYRGLLGHLRRFAKKSGGRSFSLLDMATGHGDIPVAIARWARSEGLAVQIVGLELDSVTARTALAHTRELSEISIARGDAFRPPFSPCSFDFVHASQLLHHFSEEEIVAALRTWSKIARKGILVSDLIRHPLAYYGISALTRLFTSNKMTRTDAPLSVQRAFTLDEWRELFTRANVARVDVAPLFPFRVFAAFYLEGSRAVV